MRLGALAISAVLVLPQAAVARADVQQSHIESNIPGASEFAVLLERDLVSFFRQNGYPGVERVEVRLLRDAPTQSGLAHPKYYAWVMVATNGKTVQQGAVRVAAVDRIRFEVTDFVSQGQVRGATVPLDRIFPAALLPAIRQLAGN